MTSKKDELLIIEAKRIIKEEPEKILKSQRHRPGNYYVKVRRHRIYFTKDFSGEITIDSREIYRPYNYKDRLKKIIRKIIQIVTIPWIFRKVLLLNTRQLKLLALVFLIALRIFGPQEPWFIPFRFTIASFLGVPMSSVVHTEGNWYKVSGERITAGDKTREPITIIFNPMRWLANKPNSAKIERTIIGSDQRHYGKEYINVDYNAGDYRFIKDGRIVNSREAKSAIMHDKNIVPQLGSDIERKGKISGEKIKIVNGRVIIEDAEP